MTSANHCSRPCISSEVIRGQDQGYRKALSDVLVLCPDMKKEKKDRKKNSMSFMSFKENTLACQSLM